ncbi:PPE domain-containing protein [Nocardia flavorosea]|uniref:PPE domain-containing protein n=1 Tax=Nocardia flavorosea TaxID=53429 RepID=UPI002458C53F|nr:PPE domain-containing protein [Nocardia flavorosea]
MIEPPGFTGVVWQARPAEQLAHNLNAGAGTAQLAESVAAWTRLSAQFGTALLDYDRILATLRQAWRSDNSTAFLEQITTLRTALEKAAAAAATNATRTADHIVDYEVARAAMPHPVELSALADAQRLLAQVSATLGAPLLATGDETDTQQDVAKTHAARVMRTYETSSEPLAMPWQHEPPQVVAPDTALRAEQAAARTPTPPPPVSRAVAAFPRMPTVSIPRELTAYRSTPTAQSSPSTQYSPAASTAQPEAGNGRMMPGAMAQATGTGDNERNSRGSESPYRSDPDDVAGHLQAAPAVLGVADAPTSGSDRTDGTSAEAAR